VADSFSFFGKRNGAEQILNPIKGHQAEIETRYNQGGIDAKAPKYKINHTTTGNKLPEGSCYDTQCQQKPTLSIRCSIKSGEMPEIKRERTQAKHFYVLNHNDHASLCPFSFFYSRS
jgi:hypothetical protein